MEFQLTLREGLVSDVIRAIRDWGMTVSVDDVLIVMEGGNLPVLRYLLDSDIINSTYRDSLGLSLMDNAVISGNIDIVDMLLEYGMKFSETQWSRQYSAPLIIMIQQGSYFLSELASRGFNFNILLASENGTLYPLLAFAASAPFDTFKMIYNLSNKVVDEVPTWWRQENKDLLSQS